MIKMLYRAERARFAPVIICDSCGQPITNAGRAGVVFANVTLSGNRPADGATADVRHAHKGPCLDQAEAAMGGRELTGWIEMTEHLRFLLGNTGLTPAALAEADADDEKFGRL